MGNELEEAALDTDPSKICEENEPEEMEDPVDKETGGRRKLPIQGKWRGVDPVVFSLIMPLLIA